MDIEQQAKLKYYMGLDYPVEVSLLDKRIYIAWSRQLGISGRGETEREALAEYNRKQQSLFERSTEYGQSISYPAQVVTDASDKESLTLEVCDYKGRQLIFFLGEPHEPGYIGTDAIPDIITALQTIQREIKEGKHNGILAEKVTEVINAK